jgi:outer membrane protein TolC
MKKNAIIVFIALCLSSKPGVPLAEEVLTWQACIAEAQRNQPDLISAQEAIKQSQASKKVIGSTLLPQIDSSVDISTSTTAGRSTDSYEYGASATQLLFNGLKTSQELKSAAERVKASQHSYRFSSASVRLRLRTAFIDALKAQESLNITEEISKLRRDNLMLIALRYESGIEHRGALLTAQANLDEAGYEINQAHRTLAVAKRQLSKEMGRLTVGDLRVEGPFSAAVAVSQKPDFEMLSLSHPSLARLTAQSAAASFDLKAARADWYPQISAQAGAGRSSATRWPPQTNHWNAGLSLSLPLFEGGLRLAEIDQANAALGQARADEQSSRGSIIVGLEQAWAALVDAFDAVTVQKKFLEAADERSKIAAMQYSLGLIQFDNWTIIEDDLVRAKKAFLDAQANALYAEANWIYAKGESLENADQ